MKRVTIPTWRSPYIVILNGVKYVYAAGEQVEVPDSVAAIIEADIRAHEAAKAPEQKPGSIDCVKSVNGIAPDAHGNVQVKPKLLLELRIPGVNQGFDRHQRWDDGYKAFQAYDEDGTPIAWNLDWWKDSQLPANTTLPEILQSLFDSLQVYEPMYMEVCINEEFRVAGYPTFTHYTPHLGEVDDRLMVVVSDILHPYTESDATSVIEVGRKMISCSFSMGTLCQENGWSVRIYGISKTGSDGADDDSGTEGDASADGDSGDAKTIFFTITDEMGNNPVTYSAIEGMTWDEWCESEYNTGGIFVENGVVYNQDYHYLTYENSEVKPSEEVKELSYVFIA